MGFRTTFEDVFASYDDGPARPRDGVVDRPDCGVDGIVTQCFELLEERW